MRRTYRDRPKLSAEERDLQEAQRYFDGRRDTMAMQLCSMMSRRDHPPNGVCSCYNGDGSADGHFQCCNTALKAIAAAFEICGLKRPEKDPPIAGAADQVD